MSAIVIGETIRIPLWVRDLESFRCWAKSDEFPAWGWFAHLKGELWVDASGERWNHNRIRLQFLVVIGSLVKKEQKGHYIPGRMLLTQVDAELSTEPDGMFYSYEALRTGRVVLAEGSESIEVEGAPEMVLEVLSPKTVRKDTEVLRELYWQAGIREYWLVDPRGEQVAFDIFRLTTRGYVARRPQAGWLKSAVFGKSFRLTQSTDALGYPESTLEMR